MHLTAQLFVSFLEELVLRFAFGCDGCEVMGIAAIMLTMFTHSRFVEFIGLHDEGRAV